MRGDDFFTNFIEFPSNQLKYRPISPWIVILQRKLGQDLKTMVQILPLFNPISNSSFIIINIISIISPCTITQTQFCAKIKFMMPEDVKICTNLLRSVQKSNALLHRIRRRDLSRRTEENVSQRLLTYLFIYFYLSNLNGRLISRSTLILPKYKSVSYFTIGCLPMQGTLVVVSYYYWPQTEKPPYKLTGRVKCGPMFSVVTITTTYF